MLAKKFRLQIQNWLKEKPVCAGRNKKIFSRRSDFFIVRFSANSLDFSRFGAVISKKVSKFAVKRNKIKRIIFDFIRLNKIYESPHINYVGDESKGKDVVIAVLPPTEKLKKIEIEMELKKILISIFNF
ncbi:ribonuclease P protein component [Candidatus Wolfebacteria bacterium]|nr:ribonuclease P protein component [Candidatus Wolfebacteria bacterium]